jgi:hypothetical protein
LRQPDDRFDLALMAHISWPAAVSILQVCSLFVTVLIVVV